MSSCLIEDFNSNVSLKYEWLKIRVGVSYCRLMTGVYSSFYSLDALEEGIGATGTRERRVLTKTLGAFTPRSTVDLTRPANRLPFFGPDNGNPLIK